MGLLGLFAGYRSIWVEGWGRRFGVAVARTEAVMDGLMLSKLYLLGKCLEAAASETQVI